MELEYNHCNETHYVEITYSTFVKLKIQTFIDETDLDHDSFDEGFEGSI